MQLPNAGNASIPAEKLRDYLLNEHNVQNNGKARLFAALGYSRDNWDVLARDLREQHLSMEAVEVGPGQHGRRYQITAPLVGPAGSASIMSIWQIDFSTEVPRFITAYPA